MTEDYWGDGYWGDGYWGTGYWGQGGGGPPIPPVVTATVGDAWLGPDVAKHKPPFTGSKAKMALPKRKLLLIKQFLESELDE